MIGIVRWVVGACDPRLEEPLQHQAILLWAKVWTEGMGHRRPQRKTCVHYSADSDTK